MIHKEHFTHQVLERNPRLRELQVFPMATRGTEQVWIDSQAQMTSYRRQNVPAMKSRANRPPPELCFLKADDVGRAPDSTREFAPAAVVRHKHSAAAQIHAQESTVGADSWINHNYMNGSCRKLGDCRGEEEGGKTKILRRYFVTEIQDVGIRI